jgi:neutral ceramidase
MGTPVLAGWATVQITPDLPCRMGGYVARTGPASVVHDPLYAQALALGTPELPFVVIICDLLAIDETIVDEVRRLVAARQPYKAIWLGATHTHSGPDVVPSLSFSPVAIDPAPRQHIIAGAARAAQEAIAHMHPAKIKWASGSINGIATNRDHPEQNADLSLDLLCFYDEPGQAQPSAILGSFPCHPTVMGAANLAISADLPGAFRRQFKALLGNTPWIALATGAAGDISTRHTRRGQGFDELERLGGLMAWQADDLLSTAQPLALAPPDIRSAVVSLERSEPIAPETLALHARRVQARMNAERQVGHLEQARTLETTLQGIQAAQMKAPAKEERARVITLSVALLGEMAFAAVPGELYNRLGAAIKQASGQSVLLLGYTNGYVGYLPSREAYEELDYEVLMSQFAPGACERLVQTVAQLLRSE